MYLPHVATPLRWDTLVQGTSGAAGCSYCVDPWRTAQSCHRPRGSQGQAPRCLPTGEFRWPSLEAPYWGTERRPGIPFCHSQLDPTSN